MRNTLYFANILYLVFLNMKKKNLIIIWKLLNDCLQYLLILLKLTYADFYLLNMVYKTFIHNIDIIIISI